MSNPSPEETAEANHAAYNCCRIVRLSSGRFAVFSPHSNDDGISLMAIGTADEVSLAVLSVEECDAQWELHHARDRNRFANMLGALGLTSGAPAPQGPIGIRRRV